MVIEIIERELDIEILARTPQEGGRAVQRICRRSVYIAVGRGSADIAPESQAIAPMGRAADTDIRGVETAVRHQGIYRGRAKIRRLVDEIDHAADRTLSI